MQTTFTLLIARIFMAALFILSGWGKVTGDMSQLAAYIASTGFPGFLAWPVAIFELAAGVLLLVGFQTRWVGLALAAFCAFTAIVYHNPSDPAQMTSFLKNIALAGGYLMFFNFGGGKLSVDLLIGLKA